MGLEDLFDRYPTVPRVLDWLIKYKGYTTPIDYIADGCHLTESEVIYALDIFSYFGLIEKHDKETEQFYSLSDSDLANVMVKAFDTINLIKDNKKKERK